MPRTVCAASNVACTDETAYATCCVVVSRSKRYGALAASCAWTSGGSVDEEKTVSETGVAFEPSAKICPFGTTAAYARNSAPAATPAQSAMSAPRDARDNAFGYCTPLPSKGWLLSAALVRSPLKLLVPDSAKNITR